MQVKNLYIIWKQIVFCFIAMSLIMACTQTNEPDNTIDLPTDPMTEDPIVIDQNQAAVIGVSLSGEESNYTFNVTISSPDTGCDQYADWWEVITQDGQLIYRRILGHSHVDEQPFTRSGGIVDISSTDFIYVRAHMNNLGYGSLVFSGTITDGLAVDTLETSFAEELLTIEPLPTSCAY